MSTTPTPTAATPPLAPPVVLRHGLDAGAWLTLLWISVEQLSRGRRLLGLALAFALPSLIALAARYDNQKYAGQVQAVENSLIFYMVPQVLLPLTALVLASGMVRDEVEGQTLTYVLIRPLPRPAIYVAKLVAAWIVSAGLAAVFTALALAVVHWGTDGFWGTVFPGRAARVAALGALSLLVYVSLFGGLSLVVRWVLPLGVAYTVVFEGLFANIDFSVRRVTVLWYVRVLAERWLGLHVDAWSIDLEQAPGAPVALLTLLTAALVLTLAAATYFGAREIRMKTPEGG